MRRIAAAIILALVIGAPVMAAESTSGRASASRHLELPFTVETATTVTVDITFTLTKSVVVLDVSGPNGCATTVDQRWGRNQDVTTTSCTLEAPAGTYLAQVWTFSGWTTATITVSP